MQMRTSLAISALVFASVLAALAPVPSAAVPVLAGERDSVDCGPSSIQAGVSNETLDKWLDAHGFRAFNTTTVATTSVADPMPIDFSKSPHFIGHVGGGGGSRVLYDASIHVLAVCQNFDTSDGIFIFSRVPAPPFAVRAADLSKVTTGHGIHLGSTLAAVRAVYGTAQLGSESDGTGRGVEYLRLTPAKGPGYDAAAPSDGSTATPYAITTYFVISDGKVTSFGRTTGLDI